MICIVGSGKAQELYSTSVFTGDEAERIALVSKSLETPEAMMVHSLEGDEALKSAAGVRTNVLIVYSTSSRSLSSPKPP